MGTRTRLLLAGFAIVTGCAVTTADAQDATPPSAEEELFSEITRIWQARQDRCESGIIRWTQDEFYEEGAYGIDERVESIIVEYEFAFKMDGLCTYTLDGLRWNLDTDQFDHGTLQQANFYGEVKTLFAGQRHGRFPAGWICNRQTVELGENFNIEPPLFAFRPLAPAVSWFRIAEWDVVGDSDEINGQTCVHLAKENEHLWLDPQREYLPIRHEWWLQGELWKRLDTDYAPHEIAGWTPRTWQHIQAGYWDRNDQFQQRVMKGFSSTVSELELNTSIPDSKFDLVFPPGTRVRNEKTGEGGIIREDGTFRLIDIAELRAGVSWEELMHSDPPSVVNHRVRIRFWSFITIGIVGTVGLILYRRHRSV